MLTIWKPWKAMALSFIIDNFILLCSLFFQVEKWNDQVENGSFAGKI